jgi:hypothetical protein
MAVIAFQLFGDEIILMLFVSHSLGLPGAVAGSASPLSYRERVNQRLRPL